LFLLFNTKKKRKGQEKEEPLGSVVLGVVVVLVYLHVCRLCGVVMCVCVCVCVCV